MQLMNTNTKRNIWLVASGDLRLAANQQCWPAQQQMEDALTQALERRGYSVERAHPYSPEQQHGFITSQKMGIEVFHRIPAAEPVIAAEALWQYSQHVLPGLMTHSGPVLTVANWSGQWPGLVGLLNLNASLTKAGIAYSSIWSETFRDPFFEAALDQWLQTGSIRHTIDHVEDFEPEAIPAADEQAGRVFADGFRHRKSVIGVFDEGCMGMFNAIVPDSLLNPTGIFKERLSQSALYARMCAVSREEAEAVLSWLLDKGMRFNWGTDEKLHLTRSQTLEQCRMYIAAIRMAAGFGCDAIGIQYQQGLMDLTAASDLVEGLLNNTDRPPVFAENGNELYAGRALPHFNEVDECAAIDGLLTYRLWETMGMPGENTLHDIRWGEDFETVGGEKEFVWVLMISGAVPPAHFENGYRDAVSERQPPMFFHKGGGTVKGVAKPGHIVWSRIYIMDGGLHCDLGVGEAVQLPDKETIRRWNATNPEWPIMHAVLKGVSRDQMMARHKSNHIQVVYATDEKTAHRACRIKAAAMTELGIRTHFCGAVDIKGSIVK